MKSGGHETGDYLAAADKETGAGDAVSSVSLHAICPNPFSGETRISFALPGAAKLRLSIYDVSGRRIRTLTDEIYSAGIHTVPWDGTDDGGRAVSSGVFFCRLVAGGETDSSKLILMH
jgi:hypothetical protein